MYCLIFVSSAYIPNLGPLGPSLPFEKFLVVVGGWVVVAETNFVQLGTKVNTKNGLNHHFSKGREGTRGPKFGM